MTGRELRSKVSSLFDVAAQHKSMKNAGSSIISFVVDPRRQSSTAPMPPRFRKVWIGSVQYFRDKNVQCNCISFAIYDL